RATRTAMTARTTNSSMRVKARRWLARVLGRFMIGLLEERRIGRRDDADEHIIYLCILRFDTQEPLEPEDRPPIPLAGGLRVEVEEARHLLVRQPLVRSQEQDLLIRLGQPGHRPVDAVNQFVLMEFLAGCRLSGQEWLGERERRSLRKRHLQPQGSSL